MTPDEWTERQSDSLRSDFEAWVKGELGMHHVELPEHLWPAYLKGAWEGWQAATRRVAEAVETVRLIEELRAVADLRLYTAEGGVFGKRVTIRWGKKYFYAPTLLAALREAAGAKREAKCKST